MFQASITSAQVLLPDSQASLISLLLEGHSLLALATIMFAPGGINQVRRPLSTKPPAWSGWMMTTTTWTPASGRFWLINLA